MIAFTIISIVLITALFLVWFFSHKSQEKERLLLIEKGIDLPPQTRSFSFRFPWLKMGLVISGIAFGMILGMWLEEQFPIQVFTTGFIVVPFTILFGGLGMILAHYLGKEKK